jgi:hypothetical protein
MGEEIKDVNKKIDDAEAAMKKYASKDTVISIGGYEFTPAKLMVAFTLVSSTLGALYGAFEVYKDYQGMKDKIAKYVSPDLTEIYKKLDVVQTQNLEMQKQGEKSVQYTQDIKNDLKQDVRRVEGIVEGIERSTKQAQRETDQSIQAVRGEMTTVRTEVRAATKEVDNNIRQLSRETDTQLKQIERSVDVKIQKALDNPLSK